ncbi:MAG: nuclear transport factor 2 family protein [Halieaceae bacterium]|nr:nuclear transport factor 2 family protein [Halieaceae bacterium]MBT4853165.1 nuclear transport factor 2 family protein [Halieaceae bacterium]MBT5209053.1 nuclear transport factor 2 family protein [Halieaceae bacterium]MBT6263655.1 nuclear transport factor 2 family protein [Halieaceae bacterium]MBT6333779.1 nuclear transport factor 2 family protein [Halieaceae bacterium]
MSQAPVTMVKTFYRAAPQADWPEVIPLLHPDFEIIESPALPFSGRYCGLEGLKILGRTLVANYSRFDATPKFFYEGSEGVIARVALSAVVRSGGRSFDTEIAECFGFTDGLIREIHPFYWNPQLLESSE